MKKKLSYILIISMIISALQPVLTLRAEEANSPPISQTVIGAENDDIDQTQPNQDGSSQSDPYQGENPVLQPPDTGADDSTVTPGAQTPPADQQNDLPETTNVKVNKPVNPLTVAADPKTLLIVDTTGTEEVFRVTWNLDSTANIHHVQFAVWTEDKGQDDLKWITAAKSGNTYVADIQIKDFKKFDKYNVHAYAWNNNNTVLANAASSFTVSQKPAATMTITSVDETTGTFKASITVEEALSGVKEIQVPTWSKSDQSDIYWYKAVKQANGSYLVNGSIANHQYHFGKYTLHTYVTMNNGTQTYTGSANVEILSTIQTDIKNINNTAGTFRVVVSGADALVNGGTVIIPVWSAANQNDIVWYQANRTSDGAYYIDVNISKHNYNHGTYKVHVYLKKPGGTIHILQTSSQEVALSYDSFIVTDANGTEEIFTATLENPSLQGYPTVQFAIWSEVNGQDDLKWVTASKTGNDYVCNIPVKDYKKLGDYHVHAYAKDKNGGMHFIGTSKFTVNSRPAATTELITVDDSSGTFKVKVTVTDALSGVSEVLVPIWSTSNQSDIYWYKGAKQADGTYLVNGTLANHKYHFGSYKVHTYVTMNNGIQYNTGQNAFSINNSISIDVKNVNNNAGTFRLEVSGISALVGSGTVMIPTWSATNQNDIVWYQAAKSSGGTYYVDVNISRHKYNTGTYQAHLYIKTASGAMHYLKGTSQAMKITYDSISAVDKTGKEETFAVTLVNPVLQGISTVQLAVWSEVNGQDDLKWLTATKSGNNYVCDIPIKNHGNLGKYNVHAYAMDNAKGMHIIGGTTFSVVTPPAGSVKITSVNHANGTFNAVVTVSSALSGVKEVQIPVWTASNQNDIRWYTATRQSDGTYIANVHVKNHKYNFGNYNIHAYVTMNNGVRSGIATTTTKLTATNYIYQEDIGNGQYRVTVVNPNVPNLSTVLFPTWSETNGQDDLVWYTGTRSGDRWSAVINGRNHRSAGTFTTHVYGQAANGSRTGLGGISYQVPISAVSIWPLSWGGTFIEVDISKQMLRYVRDYNIMFESLVVTGLPPYMSTPAGTFSILSKSTNTVLVGADYRTMVSYWMPFTYQGHGFHDANWQPWFGGNRYITNGSHGCVNMAFGDAATLYSLISVGTTVIIHY